MKTKAVNIRIDMDLKDKFKAYCDRRCITFSKWLRKKMIEELENENLQDQSNGVDG